MFEARFRSLVVQREAYFVQAARYIVRNPVSESWVGEPELWPWSTYRATAGIEPRPSWLDTEWIRWAFKTDDLGEARRRYVDYVKAPAGSRPEIALRGLVLGSRRFEARMIKAQKARDPELYLAQQARVVSRPTMPQLFAEAQTSSPSRDRLIHLARVQHGYRLSQIARYLGIDRSTASKAAARFLLK